MAVHQFGSGNGKIEQRFLLGKRTARSPTTRPMTTATGTTAYTCRFANDPLSWKMVADWAYSVGVKLFEIPSDDS